MALMVAKDSPLQGLADLKGKRMGTFAGIASMVLAKAVVRSALDPDKDITLIETPPGNIVQALAAGQIDAYFAPEPFGMMGEANGVARRLIRSPLLLLDLKTGIPGAPFSFNARFLKEKPLVARKVKAAYYRAAQLVKTNSHLAIDWVAAEKPAYLNENAAGNLDTLLFTRQQVSNAIGSLGEETGRLDEMLIKIADRFDIELRTTVKRLLSLLEPALILIMGILVGFIVIAMLTAIFSINELPF